MNHLAIIPDGNRRWAKAHKLESFFGHKKGVDAVQSAISVCIKNGIKYLSFYTFSQENINRPELEKTYLFKLLSSELCARLPELIKEKVRVRFLGDRAYFPESILPAIREIETTTEDLNVLNLNLLFFYGGQQEITHAVQKIVSQVQQGNLALQDISSQTIKDNLLTSGMPDPDLIIRTGGVSRLSNFLLYQGAYSELMFLDAFWPEANEPMLQNCIDRFTSIKRNFGH